MYKLRLLVLLHCYWLLSPPTFLRENVLWQFRSSLQLSKDTPHVGVLCTSVVLSLVSRLRNWCVQLGSWGVPSSPAWGDLNYLVDLDLSLFCVHGLCRANSMPQTSFSYSRACATLCLCHCSVWEMCMSCSWCWVRSKECRTHPMNLRYCFASWVLRVFFVVAPFPKL